MLLAEPGETVRPCVKANRSAARYEWPWFPRRDTAYPRPTRCQAGGQPKAAHPTPRSPHTGVLVAVRPYTAQDFCRQPAPLRPAPNLHYHPNRDGSLELFELGTLATHPDSTQRQLCQVYNSAASQSFPEEPSWTRTPDPRAHSRAERRQRRQRTRFHSLVKTPAAAFAPTLSPPPKRRLPPRRSSCRGISTSHCTTTILTTCYAPSVRAQWTHGTVTR